MKTVQRDVDFIRASFMLPIEVLTAAGMASSTRARWSNFR